MNYEVNVLKGNRLKVGDRQPHYRAQLLEDGYPFDLNAFGVSNVDFRMRRSDADTSKVDTNDVDIIDANRGIIKYEWKEADVDADGTYLVEIVVSDSNEESISFPSTGFERMYITDTI